MSTRESNPLFASFVPLPVSTHIDFCQVEVPGEESQFALSKKRRIEVHIVSGYRILTNKFLSDRRPRRLAPGAQFNTIYSHYNPNQSELLKGHRIHEQGRFILVTRLNHYDLRLSCRSTRHQRTHDRTWQLQTRTRILSSNGHLHTLECKLLPCTQERCEMLLWYSEVDAVTQRLHAPECKWLLRIRERYELLR